MTIATSTVALTIYNVVATSSGARTLDEITQAVRAWCAQTRQSVPPEQLSDAVRELVARGLLRHIGHGLLDVADRARRVVLERDRDGDGWGGWRVHARPTAAPQTVLLSEAVR